MEREKDALSIRVPLCNFPLSTALILSDLGGIKNNFTSQKEDLERIKQTQWQGQFVWLLQVWQDKKPQSNSDFYFLHLSKSKRISSRVTAAGLSKIPITHLLPFTKAWFLSPKLPWGRNCAISSVTLGLSEVFFLLALKHFLCLHPQENNHRKVLTQCWSGLGILYSGFTPLMFSVGNHKPILDLTGKNGSYGQARN